MGKRKLDFSSPSQSKLTKLSAFGFSSADSSNVVSETSSSPKPSSSNKGASTNVTPDAKYNVLGNSKIAGSLAVRGSDMTKLKLTFCDICVNSQIVNSFTTGCDIMKKECEPSMTTERVSYFVVSIPGSQSYIFLEHRAV